MKIFKSILTLLGLFTALTGHAQVYSSKYVSITSEHWSKGVKISQATKFKPGVVIVGKETIRIDTTAYVIVKHGSLQLEDEHMLSQALILLTTTKTGKYKALDCVLLLKPDKSISEVIVHKTKNSVISYLIN